MAKGRKQFKVVKSSEIDQNELMDMFNQLTGDPSKLDPLIVKDKYERLVNNIKRCNKLILKFKEAILDQLHTKIGNDPFFDNEVKNLVEFVKSVDEYLDTPITDDNLVHFYQALKDSFVIEEYLKICKALRNGEDCIKDRCSLSYKFIQRSVGEELFIFDFAKINFKHLFSHILEENFPETDDLNQSKQYILLMFNMLYITTQDIYNIVSSPDVDIDKLSELIVKAITSAKKQIPRCDKAFRLIENSVDMLKNGMSSYYKDFVASGNPAIIFENFINDIAGDLHIDTQTLSQFKRIIFHFRKQANAMPNKNAKLEGVFGTLDKIVNIMEKDTDDV
jgi:ubiquinone biosynthesis protein Coq4